MHRPLSEGFKRNLPEDVSTLAVLIYDDTTVISLVNALLEFQDNPKAAFNWFSSGSRLHTGLACLEMI